MEQLWMSGVEVVKVLIHYDSTSNKLKSELENIQNPVLHENKRKAEMLMKYWGVYYY
jgi:hypothetical protein